MITLDLKNTNSNIILIIVEKRGRGDLQKDFSSCLNLLELRNSNLNIIWIRGVKRGEYPQKFFFHVYYEFGLKLRVLESGILIQISF